MYFFTGTKFSIFTDVLVVQSRVHLSHVVQGTVADMLGRGWDRSARRGEGRGDRGEGRGEREERERTKGEGGREEQRNYETTAA